MTQNTEPAAVMDAPADDVTERLQPSARRLLRRAKPEDVLVMRVGSGGEVYSIGMLEASANADADALRGRGWAWQAAFDAARTNVPQFELDRMVEADEIRRCERIAEGVLTDEGYVVAALAAGDYHRAIAAAAEYGRTARAYLRSLAYGHTDTIVTYRPYLEELARAIVYPDGEPADDAAQADDTKAPAAGR